MTDRLIITDREIRIINAENPGQYHAWPASEGLGPARKVAEAWEDRELLGALAEPPVIESVMAEGDGITISPPIIKPRRGRKPKITP